MDEKTSGKEGRIGVSGKGPRPRPSAITATPSGDRIHWYSADIPIESSNLDYLDREMPVKQKQGDPADGRRQTADSDGVPPGYLRSHTSIRVLGSHPQVPLPATGKHPT